MKTGKYREQYFVNGYTVIEDVFSEDEIEAVLNEIAKINTDSPVFRKSNDLFAIRQFLKQVPEAEPFIFTEKLNNLIATVFGEDYFVVKSIYFDKPEHSNWFVAYHQDLTISVDRKSDIDGYGPWTVKQNQFAVQPPLVILQNNFTIRIHLDDTDAENGALKVIPASHVKGVIRFESLEESGGSEVSCQVKKGGVMLMSPLLLHASNRTTNDKKRRVIHIEFSNQSLSEGLNWSEYLNWRN
jgi:ectoine hydroxylase-related dioxygenase (phytanoyl-CoA dioxygenase family)